MSSKGLVSGKKEIGKRQVMSLNFVFERDILVV